MASKRKRRVRFGSRFYERVCLLTPDRPDSRDYDLASYLGPAARGLPVPPGRDYAGDVGPVADQGETGSCVGWAAAHGLRRWLTGLGKAAPRLSVRFLWMGTKETDIWPLNVINDLAGTSIRSAFKVLNRTGVPLEQFYPFARELVRCGPEKWNDLLASAHEHRIGRYYNLDDNRAMEIQLAHSGPFVCGVPIYDNFSRLESGVVPEPTGRLRGGHAILVTGYDSDTQLFKFMNSWGTGWGNRGFGCLTYEWMEKYSHSAWATARL
ncbi:MAG: C1 family peptidase [Candidatus Eisenbacteria sp.]|nr:C1 family peptidase [Candidatus Eisenbacteria bacterium]